MECDKPTRRHSIVQSLMPWRINNVFTMLIDAGLRAQREHKLWQLKSVNAFTVFKFDICVTSSDVIWCRLSILMLDDYWADAVPPPSIPRRLLLYLYVNVIWNSIFQSIAIELQHLLNILYILKSL